MLVAAPGAGATVATAHPYADWNFGFPPANPISAIGSTNPGNPDSVICILGVKGVSGDLTTDTTADPATFTAGVLNTIAVLDDTTTVTPSCTLTDITITFGGTTPVGSAKTHSAKVNFTSVNTLQPGISAGAATEYTITKQPGQTVTAALGTLSPSGGAQVGVTSVLYTSPGITVTTKSSLTATCADTDLAVNLTDIDPVTLTPYTKELGFYDTDAPEDWNVATFHECAQAETQTPGKASKVALVVTGAGAVSVAFHRALTFAPKTWDTTLGKCKETNDAARVLTCKGGFGKPVPFVLNVHTPDPAWGPGVGGDHGKDVNGLLHKADVDITETHVTIP
jgi:hypothetical protein